MKRLCLALIAATVLCWTPAASDEVRPPQAAANAELNSVQCPIPPKDRVPNYSRIQCVWSSLECLARWADCRQLLDPPLTSRPQCQSFAGPREAADVLNANRVYFEQARGDRGRGLLLIRKAMANGRGCLFDIPGHAMVLVHFDEKNKVVKYINNSEKTLTVRAWTLDEFYKRWDTWVLVIYANPDPFPWKTGRAAQQIPVLDRNPSKQSGPVPTPIK